MNGYTQVHDKTDEKNVVLIKRVTDGFIIDCDSPEMDLWLNEGADQPADMSDLIPVVGHIDVKPNKSGSGMVFGDHSAAVNSIVIQ